MPRQKSVTGNQWQSKKQKYPVTSYWSLVTGRWLLPLLTSLLLILSYPKFNQGWLAWFAFAPITLYFKKSENLKQCLWSGFIAGFAFYLGILYWIYFTLRAGGVGQFFSALAWILLSLVLSLEWILFSLIGFYFKKTGDLIYPYVLSAAWVSVEWLKIFISREGVWFPWFMLGYTQWQYPEMIQIVSVTGVYGLGFAVCLAGASISGVLVNGKKPSVRLAEFLPAILIPVFLFWFGRHEIKKSEIAGTAGNVKFSVLQPNIDFYKKWDGEYEEWIKNRIKSLIEKTRSFKPDVIIWPENALPGWIDDPFMKKWLDGIVAKSGRFHIVGSVSKADGRRVSSFLLDSSGGIKASYDKRELVPFGEYVPFRKALGKFIDVVGALGEFEPGETNQKLFKIDNGVKIANSICYESIFPYLQKGDVQKGADILVNITNDGWYLDTAAPYQHFTANIFRAVENRKFLIRAANTGISAVIDPWGRVIEKTELNEYRILNLNVPGK